MEPLPWANIALRFERREIVQPNSSIYYLALVKGEPWPFVVAYSEDRREWRGSPYGCEVDIDADKIIALARLPESEKVAECLGVSAR